MKTCTYTTDLKFKKVPVYVGSFHSKFTDHSTPVVEEFPSWSGTYQMNNQSYYLSVPNDYLPNQALVSLVASNDKTKYSYSGCGTTCGNVVFTNKEDKEQTHTAQFKFENYSYCVYTDNQTVKGGNLRKVVDDYASKYSGFTSWSVKFSDLQTTVDLAPGGSFTTSNTAPNAPNAPKPNTTAPTTKDDSTDEEAAPNTLFEDDDDW